MRPFRKSFAKTPTADEDFAPRIYRYPSLECGPMAKKGPSSGAAPEQIKWVNVEWISFSLFQPSISAIELESLF